MGTDELVARAGELILPPADDGIGRPSQGRELIQAVWIRASSQAATSATTQAQIKGSKSTSSANGRDARKRGPCCPKVAESPQHKATTRKRPSEDPILC